MTSNFAGFWVRFFAGFLDTLFLIPPLFLLLFLFGIDTYQMFHASDSFSNYNSFTASSSGQRINLISYGLSIAYLAYFLSSKKQATIGKRIMGIYVGNRDGSRISTTKSFCRAIASILTSATLGIGFLLVIFTKEKTALHDIICNTRVFHGKKND